MRVLDNYQKRTQINLITNQTPFSGESGGQVGDIGFITSGHCKINIVGILKYLGKLYGHVCELEEGLVTEMTK